MLKLSYILNNKKKIIKSLKKRQFNNLKLIDEIIYLYKKFKLIKKKKDKLLNKINKFSKNFFKKGINKNILLIKNKKKKINKKCIKIEKKIYKKNILLPNILNPLYFKIKNKKKIIYKYGYINKKKKYLTHIELAKKIEIFDKKLASNLSGSGFAILSGKGLKLYKALVNFFIYFNKKEGYKEYILPYLVNKNTILGTGQYPEKKTQLYKIEKQDLFLIPTGEVPLINLYRNKIFNINELPIKSQTYTDCFRKEAGSYGKNVKGLNRIHQFGKVEIIEISDINSDISLKRMFNHIKKILKLLNLKFRIILLPAKDIGFTSSITYDFEVYSVGQKKWLEVSSLSNCLNYQSNNLNIKYKNKNNIYFCHTLNGSCLSLPRILLSIIELNQKKNTIEIPKILLQFYK